MSDHGLHGGGWSMLTKGGKLNPHLDYSLHPKIYAQRKFNLIVFLSKSWKKNWGGELSFYLKKYQIVLQSLLLNGNCNVQSFGSLFLLTYIDYLHFSIQENKFVLLLFYSFQNLFLQLLYVHHRYPIQL